MEIRTRERCSSGFTLIELMVVIAIIAIIAAIAVPNMLAARKAANERSVIAACRAVIVAQTLFRDRDMDRNGRYDYATSLGKLSGLIDPELASGEKYDYSFQFISTNQFKWGMRATCLHVGKSGDNGYWVDDTGVIRVCNGNFADTTDPPIG